MTQLSRKISLRKRVEGLAQTVKGQFLTMYRMAEQVKIMQEVLALVCKYAISQLHYGEPVSNEDVKFLEDFLEIVAEEENGAAEG